MGSQAKAEAQSIAVKAQAEADRAKLLAATPLGEKLALLNVYGSVVAKSNEGVEKVVYMDPSLVNTGSPMSLLTVQALKEELSKLQSSKSVVPKSDKYRTFFVWTMF